MDNYDNNSYTHRHTHIRVYISGRACERNVNDICPRTSLNISKVKRFLEEEVKKISIIIEILVLKAE